MRKRSEEGIRWYIFSQTIVRVKPYSSSYKSIKISLCYFSDSTSRFLRFLLEISKFHSTQSGLGKSRN